MSTGHCTCSCHERLGKLSLQYASGKRCHDIWPYSSEPALLISSVGSGAEQFRGAVEQYPAMAGSAALLAPLLRLTLHIPCGQIALG